MNNSERAAYIRGLIEGLELDQSSKEVKVISAMIELLDDLCLSIEELEGQSDMLDAKVDEIDRDLGDLEHEFYELDEDDCDCGHEHHHGHHHHHHDDEDLCGCGCEDDDWDEDDDCCHFQVTCPSCEDIIELSDDILDLGRIHCPNCDELLEFDFDEIAEEESEEI